MVGLGKDLVVHKDVAALELREIAAKTILRQVHEDGHPYVELRRNGKRIIFFCTICLTTCYSDTSLFDHLNGKLHARQQAAARATLLGSLPWPFNDGVLFFSSSRENALSIASSELWQHKALCHSAASGGKNEATSKLRDATSCIESNAATITAADGAIICVTDASKQSHQANERGNLVDVDQAALWAPTSDILVIPSVLHKDVIVDLGVRPLGYGNIAYRIIEDSKGHATVSKIWCAWAGNDGTDHSEKWSLSRKCDFAIVSFSYACYLGRKWNSDHDSLFLIDDAGNRGKKRKKSFSDPEVSSEESNGQSCSSMKEDVQVTRGSNETSRELQVSLISNKSARRDLRMRKSRAAERACDICGHPMLPGKDVATLLNCKTGYLACSSRNNNGAFHLFHVSCLIHWTLLCESEMLVEQLKKSKSNRGRKGRVTAKDPIASILCPECQGTGAAIEGEELERPRIPLSEMFCYKLKAIEAHKAWMRNPEILQECSTGLHFPSEVTEMSKVQEKVVQLKLAHFYGADD